MVLRHYESNYAVSDLCSDSLQSYTMWSDMVSLRNELKCACSMNLGKKVSDDKWYRLCPPSEFFCAYWDFSRQQKIGHRFDKEMFFLWCDLLHVSQVYIWKWTSCHIDCTKSHHYVFGVIFKAAYGNKSFGAYITNKANTFVSFLVIPQLRIINERIWTIRTWEGLISIVVVSFVIFEVCWL